MSLAIVGHGALIGIESVPIVAGTFVNIAELTSDLEFELTRPAVDVTPHNDDIDAMLPGGVMNRSPVPMAGNFLFANAIHDHLSGIQKHFIDNDKFGMRWRGPAGSSGVNEIIASGYVTQFKRIAPQGEGPYGFEATIVLTGLMSIDAVSIGTVGS